MPEAIYDCFRWVLFPIVLVCLAGGVVLFLRQAFRQGREEDGDNAVRFPLRWRRRAMFLRWVSWACLAFMALLVAVVVFIEMVCDLAGKLEVIGSVLVFGLFATALVSVYRYIVRLAYFYEALADAADLTAGNPAPDFQISEANIDMFVILVATVSPETVEYAKAVDSLEVAQKVKKLTQ